MEKIIYLGMENKPNKLYEVAFVKNFRVVYQYENNKGKKVMLKATKDNRAYHSANDFMQYPNNSLPECKEGELYPISILNKGYSSHYFELVEIA